MEIVVNINPESVLDIGTGFGKYGLLCREYLELWDGRQDYNHFLRRIDGVEAFEKYVTPLHEFVYDNIYTNDILKLVGTLESRYDLVLLIDVLEHFDKEDGKSLLTKILAKNKGILISTPKNPSNQKDAFNNVYETHRARWTKLDLEGLYSSTNTVDPDKGIFLIRDSTHLIAYMGSKAVASKLKRRLIHLKNIKKIPGMSYILPLSLLLMRKARIYRI
jgi:hypothetical protein